jgi:hypothetical protein
MPRNLHRSLAFAGLAALVAVPACSQTPPAESADPAAQTDASSVGLRIISHSPHAVVVSIDTGVGRERLVALGPHGVSALQIPMRLLGGSKRLRLSARERGGALASSRTSVAVGPGARVVWTIEPNLAFSSISVD